MAEKIPYVSGPAECDGLDGRAAISWRRIVFLFVGNDMKMQKNEMIEALLPISDY